MRFNEAQIKKRIFILHVILSGDVVYNPTATQLGYSNICRSCGLKTALHHFLVVHSIFNKEELIRVDLMKGQIRLIKPVRSAHALSRYEQSNVRYKQLKQKLVWQE
jgi:hypothetical protein